MTVELLLYNDFVKSATKKELEKIALELAKNKKQWHFHLLTPSCKFNKQKEHAFILENNSDNEYYVFYNDKPAMDLGKKLLSVLHGRDILGERSKKSSISNSTRKILDRAKRLNNEGKHWHHHVFFPICLFNKHAGKWNITFEDQLTGVTLESVSEVEPKDDQKEIETLYYLQKTIT